MPINSLPPNISHVPLYSDTCGGQNHNRYIAAILVSIIQHSQKITIMDHKFMESRHSHMEIHSGIETAKKKYCCLHAARLAGGMPATHLQEMRKIQTIKL